MNADDRIRGRIEFNVVDSVHDSPEVVRSCAKQSVEAFPVIFGLYLLGIGAAHRRDRVRIDHTALQHAAGAAEFKLVRREEIFRKTGDPADGRDVPDALEFQVVDRHHGTDPPVERVSLEFIPQIDRDKACLPVVAVNDIRLEPDHRKDREHRL